MRYVPFRVICNCCGKEIKFSLREDEKVAKIDDIAKDAGFVLFHKADICSDCMKIYNKVRSFDVEN